MRKLIITLLMAAPLAVSAQSLHKDINVEQETSPLRREASRITILPEVQLPALAKSRLAYSDRVVSAPVPNVISTLEPAAWADPEAAPDTRGYVAGGIFPIFNAAVSAGYRFVDSDRTRLSAWAQYDASAYHRGEYAQTPGGTPFYGKPMWRDHTASVGLDLHQAIGRKSVIDAGIDYTYGYHNMWQIPGNYLSRNTTSKVNFDAAFSSSVQGLDYSAHAKVQHFGFGGLKYTDIQYYPSSPYEGVTDPVGQNLFGIGGSGLIEVGSTSWFGLDLDLDLLHSSAHNGAVVPFDLGSAHPLDGNTSGIFSVNPRFINRTSKTSVTIGATLDVAINSGKALNVSPDVTLAWTPTQNFGIEATAKGGMELNTLASLYTGVSPYMNPFMAYKSSRVPYDLRGRMTFGPFHNVSLEVFGGYAKADGWLMPVCNGIEAGGAVFESMDIKGYHLGASAAYDNGRNFSAKVKWAMAPSEQYRAYYLWRDRARHVVDADITVRPLKKLTVNAGFEFRAGRAVYEYGRYPELTDGIYLYPVSRHSLSPVADLRLGAAWRQTDRLTFFVNGENLLSRTWQYIGNRPAQGITALIGAGYKF